MTLSSDAHMHILCITPHLKMMEVGEEGFYQNFMLLQKKPKIYLVHGDGSNQNCTATG